MLSNQDKEFLALDISQWLSEGYIDRGTYDKLAQRYEVNKLGVALALRYLGIMGGVFTLLGVLGMLTALASSATFAMVLCVVLAGACLAQGLRFANDPNRSLLASMIAGQAAGNSCLPSHLGLGKAAFLDLLADYFPFFRSTAKDEPGEEIPEWSDLQKLLLDHRAGEQDSELWIADIVATARDAVAVRAHTGHAIHLRRDGVVMGTGGNRYGPLGAHGLGDKADRWGRVFDEATAIATGSRHSLAIRADGGLWAWGEGFAIAPARILDQVSAVAAGDSATIARRTAAPSPSARPAMNCSCSSAGANPVAAARSSQSSALSQSAAFAMPPATSAACCVIASALPASAARKT